jgi:hypothetical protein
VAKKRAVTVVKSAQPFAQMPAPLVLAGKRHFLSRKAFIPYLNPYAHQKMMDKG